MKISGSSICRAFSTSVDSVVVLLALASPMKEERVRGRGEECVEMCVGQTTCTIKAMHSCNHTAHSYPQKCTMYIEWQDPTSSQSHTCDRLQKGLSRIFCPFGIFGMDAESRFIFLYQGRPLSSNIFLEKLDLLPGQVMCTDVINQFSHDTPPQ